MCSYEFFFFFILFYFLFCRAFFLFFLFFSTLNVKWLPFPYDFSTFLCRPDFSPYGFPFVLAALFVFPLVRRLFLPSRNGDTLFDASAFLSPRLFGVPCPLGPTSSSPIFRVFFLVSPEDFSFQGPIFPYGPPNKFVPLV